MKIHNKIMNWIVNFLDQIGLIKDNNILLRLRLLLLKNESELGSF